MAPFRGWDLLDVVRGDKGGLKAEEDMISSGSEGHNLESEVVCER